MELQHLDLHEWFFHYADAYRCFAVIFFSSNYECSLLIFVRVHPVWCFFSVIRFRNKSMSMVLNRCCMLHFYDTHFWGIFPWFFANTFGYSKLIPWIINCQFKFKLRLDRKFNALLSQMSSVHGYEYKSILKQKIFDKQL